MERTTEIELKYDVPDGFVLPELSGAGEVTAVGEAETHDLDATYFDTDDLLLARNRRTLRRRTGGSDSGWHLKTPGDGAGRTEHRLPLGSDEGDEGDESTVPQPLRAQVRAIIRDHPLHHVARLRTRRVETPLRDDTGRTLALLAQDEVTAESDGSEQRWSEIEVELVDGDPAVLEAVDEVLRSAGATRAGGPSKLARALGDRLSAAPAPASVDNPVVRYVCGQRDTIVSADPAVRQGDAEAVHKMRVATRRLRSTLRTYRGLWAGDQVTPVRAELRWLGECLGAVRDPQVQTGRLATAADADGAGLGGAGLGQVAARLREELGGQVEQGRAALGAALDDPRYVRLLDALDTLSETAGRAGGRRLRRRARTALRRADRLLDAAGDGPHRDEHLHEARKAYKRARYAVEVFVPSIGKPARRLVSRLTDMQDVLGDHQDTVVARQLLQDMAGRAHEAGENGFGYGVLHARQEYAGEQILRDVPAVAARVRRRKARSWL